MRWLAAIALALVLSACSSDDFTNACQACSSDQLCVARFSATCEVQGVACVARTVSCPSLACTSACEATYCPSPYQCQRPLSCTQVIIGAFFCYGP